MGSTRDNTYTNTNNRTFYLSDDVDNESIGKLIWDILYQIREDDKTDEKEKDYKREPIKLYINSYGGSVYDMWGLIDIILNSKTPIYDVVVPSDSYIKTSTRKQLTLSDEQIEEFKKAALARYKNGEYKSRDALVLMIILNLGLRAGEALALEWDNIDYENKLMYINNTIQSNIYDIKTQKLYNRVKESPKTKSGIRVLKLNDTTIFYFKELQAYDKRKNIISNYVSSTSVGTRNTYRNLERSLKRVISNTNLPQWMSLHTLRHTFGSTLIRRGISVEVVSKLMGHANIMITYNKYIHVLKEQEALAMDMVAIS